MKFKLNALCGVIALTVATPALVNANSSLAKVMKNPSNWAAQAGDNFNHRHTKLKQINKSNVNKLQMAWSFSTGVLRGHEGGPLVIDDTLYIHLLFRTKCLLLIYSIRLSSGSMNQNRIPQ